MKNEEIKYVVLSFPENFPFIRVLRDLHFPGTQTLSPVQRLLFPMVDGAFGSHLIGECLQAKVDLPKQVWWSTIRRAYRCLKYEAETKRTDPACHQAIALGHPSMLKVAAVLKGFLCSGLTYQEVASRTGFPVEVVTIFAHLYCDFPERREYLPFVAAMLDPRSELGPFQTGLADLVKIQDPALRWMNIGFHCGPEVLVKAVGWAESTNSQLQDCSPLEEAERTLIISAELKAQRGEL